jgi:hypothetical protein
MEYATRGRFDGLGLKTIGRTVSGFGPQNPSGGSEEKRGSTWWNHIGCVEAKQICARSRASDRIKNSWTIAPSGQ